MPPKEAKAKQTNQSEVTIAGAMADTVKAIKKNCKAFKVLQGLPKSAEIDAAMKAVADNNGKLVASATQRVSVYMQQVIKETMEE